MHSFVIAKYPITTLQFAQFINSGGYKEKKWWTEDGWRFRNEEAWTQPEAWNNKQSSNNEHPVVGVSWYEAVAFCTWLSKVTDEKITLPNETQWQHAAQGDDGREYPWAATWKYRYCNTIETGIQKTTPVRQYEGKGDSPFGVVDMVGNVWEWCRTDYDNGTNDVNRNSDWRVLRGGSWLINQNFAHVSFRSCNPPNYRGNESGFRVVHSRVL